MRRALVVAVLVLFAGVGLWSAVTSDPPAAPDEDVRSVAETLRCPSCVGESAADSTAPLAAGMREVIGDQLAAGRTSDEIRAWFAARYGEEVLLDPPRRGAGWLLWLLPLVGAPVAAWVALRGRERRAAATVAAGTAGAVVAALTVLAFTQGRDAPTGPPDGDTAAPLPEPVSVLEAAARHAPGDAGVRIALARALDERGRVAEAADHYRAAARLDPANDSAHYLAGFALVRSDRPGEAVPVLEELVARSPDHPEGLLLLGIVLRDRDDDRAEDLLRRFLAVAPEHPAAPEVSAQLGSPEGE